MIERGVYVQLGPPLLVSRERATLACGCFVAVGLRMDRNEAAVGGQVCGPGHADLLERFGFALTDSLVNPSSRPLIDVVDEILTAMAEGARR